MCKTKIYLMCRRRGWFTCSSFFVFFFNDTATTEIYTLSLHDALPISWKVADTGSRRCGERLTSTASVDRKSTRLNSSHGSISYAVFCLKQKNNDSNSSDDRIVCTATSFNKA